MTKEEAYYKAILARDHRFDGKFFVGVKTTGIYCRPICPARPLLKNIEFFANHLAAERAGYRPCLRCRPESAPMSPAWIGRSVLVKRAVKMINEIETLEFDENQFAERFGVSARHLRRVFAEEIGKTPKQLAGENRLNLSRQLIIETTLPITRIAYAAGFHSIRRFNDAFKQRFKKPPSEIRRKSNGKISGSTHTICLSYRPPYDFEGLIKIYRSHQIGHLEWFEGKKMYRVISHNGKSGTIAVSNDVANSKIILDIDFPDVSALYSIISKVRAMFDLDSDPAVVANSLETDKSIRKILKKHPGIRIASGWDPFEVAVSAILGQLVTVDFGRTLVADLIEMLGEHSGLERDGQKIKLFPTPDKIAKSKLDGLRTTGKRKETLIQFSKLVSQHKISLESTQDPDEFLKSVLAIPGVGPWTAAYMALKVLRHADAFPGTDLILARAVDLHSKETVQSMSPWRGYLAALFWREYSQTLKKTKEKQL